MLVFIAFVLGFEPPFYYIELRDGPHTQPVVGIVVVTVAIALIDVPRVVAIVPHARPGVAVLFSIVRHSLRLASMETFQYNMFYRHSSRLSGADIIQLAEHFKYLIAKAVGHRARFCVAAAQGGNEIDIALYLVNQFRRPLLVVKPFELAHRVVKQRRAFLQDGVKIVSFYEVEGFVRYPQKMFVQFYHPCNYRTVDSVFSSSIHVSISF